MTPNLQPHISPNRLPWHRTQARIVLLLTVVAAVAAVAITISPAARGRVGKPTRGGCDMALYRAEIERMRGGEGYYQAAAAELAPRGYPTQSVFNWRTPITMWLLSVVPNRTWGPAILGGLAVIALALGFATMTREAGIATGLAAALLLLGAMLLSVLGEAHVMPVLWAGVMIAVSLGLYGIDRPLLGATTGVAAVFVRELAAPYALVAGLMALANRRWKEFGIWCLGGAGYLAFFAWHATQVSQVHAADGGTHDGSWLQMGGAGFLIALAQVNAFWLVLPQAISGLFLVAAVVGLLCWSSEFGRRLGLTVCAYLLLFAFVGFEFNQYWGVLIAPILALAAARSGVVLRDLFWAADMRNLPGPTGRALAHQVGKA